jgi:uncharacterized membrane protein YhiD involved in acid resistance
VILHRRDNQTVEGLTTAASIWVIAAVGIAVGAGLWRASIIVVVILVGTARDRGPDRSVRAPIEQKV